MQLIRELYNAHELWKGVVLQSVTDALRPLSNLSEIEQNCVMRDIRYILKDPDFNIVCIMADLNPDNIRRSLRRKLKINRKKK